MMKFVRVFRIRKCCTDIDTIIPISVPIPMPITLALFIQIFLNNHTCYDMASPLGREILPLMIESAFKLYLIKLSGGIFMLKLLLLTSRLFVRDLIVCFFIRSAIRVPIYSTICFPLLDCTVTLLELDLIT